MARRVIVLLLLLSEPLHFAIEAMRVLPTIVYRGLVPAVELGVHALVAAICAAAAVAFFNAAADARRVLTVAVVAAVARTVQSVYWSALPNDTPPGDEVFVILVAMIIGAGALLGGWGPGRKRGRRDQENR